MSSEIPGSSQEDSLESQDRPKPSTLYHASSNRNIEEFTPRDEKVRDPEEGPGIFATPDKAIASIFIVPTDDRWVGSGKHNGVPYITISDRTRFAELDHGGAIYELPSNSFVNDPNKGLGIDEWFSPDPVRPLGKEEYQSGLEAMIQFGVQVYFTDPETYNAMRKANDHGYEMLKGLTSENQHRGMNIREF